MWKLEPVEQSRQEQTAMLTNPYQVSDGEHAVELFRHGVVLHGHEERVQHNAHCDGQVQEGVRHHDLH